MTALVVALVATVVCVAGARSYVHLLERVADRAFDTILARYASGSVTEGAVAFGAIIALTLAFVAPFAFALIAWCVVLGA